MLTPSAAVVVFLAHFLADYPLQGDFLASWKSKSWYVLFVHSFIWAGLISCGLAIFGLYTAWKFLFLLIGHFAIDGWKCRIWTTPKDKQPILKIWGPEISGLQAFFVDQTLHTLQLLVVLIA